MNSKATNPAPSAMPKLGIRFWTIRYMIAMGLLLVSLVLPPEIAWSVRVSGSVLPLASAFGVTKPWAKPAGPPPGDLSSYGGRGWIFGIVLSAAYGLFVIVGVTPSGPFKISLEWSGLAFAVVYAFFLVVVAHVAVVSIGGERLFIGADGIAVQRLGHTLVSFAWDEIESVAASTEWGEITYNRLDIQTKAGRSYAVTDFTMGHSQFRKALEHLSIEAPLRIGKRLVDKRGS